MAQGKGEARPGAAPAVRLEWRTRAEKATAATTAPTAPKAGTPWPAAQARHRPAWHGRVPAVRTGRGFARLGRRALGHAVTRAIAPLALLLAVAACSPGSSGGTDGGGDGGGERPDLGSVCSVSEGGSPLLAAPPAPYREDRVDSPLTAEVAEVLRAVAACDDTRDPKVFAKVGDSMSLNPTFLGCFADHAAVDLGAHGELAPTHAHFLEGRAGDTTPYDREGHTLEVGRNSFEQVEGDPSPLDRELAAVSPRYAVVMMGTNDLAWRTNDQYGEAMWDIVDRLMEAGVVPILNTLPPVDAYPGMNTRIADWNAALRGLAAWRRVPLIDVNRVFTALPNHGLDEDGVHPSVDWRNGGAAAACNLTEAGLQFGHNARNLATLRALDRVRAVVEARQEAFEEAPQPAPSRPAGTPDDPIPVELGPWSDLQRVSAGAASRLGAFPGCDGDGAGAEVVYRLDLTQAARVHAGLIDRPGLEAEVTVLDGTGEGARCTGHDGELLIADLAAGTWYLVVEVVSGAGEYLLTVRVE